MLTNNHLFHAVVLVEGLYLEVEVKDNATIRGLGGIHRGGGLHLGSSVFGVGGEWPSSTDQIIARLERNDRTMIDSPAARRGLIGVAEDLVRSIERDYGFRFLRGDVAGYLRQAVFALGEYRVAAFHKLPKGPGTERMYRALEAHYKRLVGARIS